MVYGQGRFPGAESPAKSGEYSPLSKQNVNILAGDIGGTKTKLAIFSSDKGLTAPLVEATFPSDHYSSLESLVREFLSRHGHGINADYASFGVAGPVMNGRAKMTNLSWIMDESALASALGFSSVHLQNDLTACACAVPSFKMSDLYTLNEGIVDPAGAMAIVAPGTGLGEAYLTRDKTGYRAYPSEGGHTDFAPTNALEAGLLSYLQTRFDHVSYERVCSGNGLPNIYNYLKDSGYAAEPGWLAELLTAVDDPVPVLIQSALDDDRPCPLCLATLQTFISILGAESGNTALRVMASGGVYLGGGILPRIIPVLQKGLFMDAFRRKGRMSGLLGRIPVHVIMNPRASLLGAACCGMALIGKDDRK